MLGGPTLQSRFSSRNFPGTSQTFSRILELGLGQGGGCSVLPVGGGAIRVESGKMENGLILLCRELARAGVLGGKLAFTATRPF